MTSAVQNPETPTEEPQRRTTFILYLDSPEYDNALFQLTLWVRHLLLPVYGREVTSTAPWCPQWWEHREAVAQLYALWMAWQELTGPTCALPEPAIWHRDFLGPTLSALRDPAGIFAGCKAGGHRPKEIPFMQELGG
jgi:hypothetical protein